MTGFEPATSGSTIRRSNQLSYTHHPEKIDRNRSRQRAILTNEETAPQQSYIRAANAACISVTITSEAALGSAASRMGRPTTK